MATSKKVFTLRLQDEVFEKIEYLAKQEHRSVTNLIEYVLLQYIKQYQNKNGDIEIDKEWQEKGRQFILPAFHLFKNKYLISVLWTANEKYKNKRDTYWTAHVFYFFKIPL